MENDLVRFIIFMTVVYAFILLTLRAFYFAFVIKVDPLKSIIPKVQYKTWFQKHTEDKELKAIVSELS